MLEQDELKWLAAHTTELNGLLQQASRYSDQARRSARENRFLELLTDRVGLAARRSQELFEHVNSQIQTVAGRADTTIDLVPARLVPPPASTHTQVKVRMPSGEVAMMDEKTATPVLRNPNGTRELILVVDDDDDVLDFTAEILDFEDYRVLTASDGPEALRIYRLMGKEIALVLLDYFLPVMDGDVIFEELKVMDPNVRVVLSSGFSEQARIGQMLAHGLRAFIPKPYTHERLVEQIRLVLDK
jgi:CheY-like chemotaxis protein